MTRDERENREIMAGAPTSINGLLGGVIGKPLNLMALQGSGKSYIMEIANLQKRVEQLENGDKVVRLTDWNGNSLYILSSNVEVVHISYKNLPEKTLTSVKTKDSCHYTVKGSPDAIAKLIWPNIEHS